MIYSGYAHAVGRDGIPRMCDAPISTNIVHIEKLSNLAQVVGSVGVIVSLIFVGLQIKHNTGAFQRNEHNSTMAQWTVIRMSVARNRDIAELMTAGLHGQSAIDGADQPRLEHRLAEYTWASFHTWDRTQRGVFPKGTFEMTAGLLLSGVLRTVRGGACWRSARHAVFIPGFVADVDAVLAKDSGASVMVDDVARADAHDSWERS